MSAVLSRPGERGGGVRQRRRLDFSAAAFALLALGLALLVVLPTGWLVWYSVSNDLGRFTLAPYLTLVTDPSLRAAMGITLVIAIGVAALSAVAALPLAFLTARTDVPLRRTIRAAVTASFVTPPFLGAIAWEILAAPNSGLLNDWARWLFGFGRYQHVFNIYSVGGVIFATACYTFPYVFTLLANAFERVPAELEDVSAILGAGRWRTARRVTLPLVLPALLAGTLVAFLQALTLFGTPAVLALPAGFDTLTTKIWSLFQYPPHTHLAAAAAMPLLVVTMFVLWGQRRLLGGRSFTVIGARSGRARLVRLGRWRTPALLLCLFIMLFPVTLPYFALFKVAFVHNISDPLAWRTLSLEHVRFALFGLSDTRIALRNTLLLGVASASIVTVVVLMAGYAASRRLVTGHRALAALAMAPMAVPGIVMGVGLFLVYTRPPLVLYGTIWILLVAFVTLEMPGGYQQVQAGLSGLHPELEEASRMFGATRLRALADITAPLLRSTIISTWCIVFIGALRELSAAILLANANTQTISVVIYNLNESGNLGAIAVLGILLMLITFAVVILVNRLPVLGGARSGGAA
ncbi:MAG: ABC transporter permease [Acetobacteraceae bacterium]